MKRKSIGRRLLVCVLVLLLTVSSMIPLIVSAETESVTGVTEGKLEYEIYDGEVTIIGCDAEVTECIIPDTINGYQVTSIDMYAFSDCENLISVSIPSSVTSIGYEEFIGEHAFSNCNKIESINVDKDNSVFTSVDGVLFSKDKRTLITYPNNKAADTYTIPDGVISIERGAFLDCPNLQNITIPGSIETLSDFGGLQNLVSVTIEEGVKSIDKNCFYNCSSLESVTIPDSIEKVGQNAFSGTAIYNGESNWENGELYIGSVLVDGGGSGDYIVKDGTKVIADYAMYGSNIESLVIPDSVERIGFRAFFDCKNLKSISISDSVIDVGSQAFDFTAYYYEESNWEDELLYIDSVLVSSKSSSREVVSIKEGTRVVAQSALMRMSGLERVIIPESLVAISQSNCYLDYWYEYGSGSAFNSYGVFDYLGRLKEFVVGENNAAFMAIDGVLVDKKTLEILRYPSGMEATEYVVPEGIKGINAGAFARCKFTSLVIPETVESINDKAFYGWWAMRNSEIVIHGYEGSCAETFAKEMELKFEAICDTTDPNETTYETVTTVTETATSEPISTIVYDDMVLMGDADLSDKVNIKDATLIQKAVASLVELSAREKFAANVISTDVLNIKDATAIQKWIVSLPVNVKISELVPYTEEDDTPSEPMTTTVAEDVAVISCGGETFTAKVGDIITYSVLLEAEQKFEDIQGNVCFDSTVLSPVSDDAEHCPNLPYAMVNQDSDDSILFLASDGYSTGFDFSREKLLFTYSFVVLSAEETELDLVIDTMTIVGGEDYYFDFGEAVVTDGISIKEVVTVA